MAAWLILKPNILFTFKSTSALNKNFSCQVWIWHGWTWATTAWGGFPAPPCPAWGWWRVSSWTATWWLASRPGPWRTSGWPASRWDPIYLLDEIIIFHQVPDPLFDFCKFKTAIGIRSSSRLGQRIQALFLYLGWLHTFAEEKDKFYNIFIARHKNSIHGIGSVMMTRHYSDF